MEREGPLIETLGKALSRARILDLTHTLETGMPAWPTQARFGSVVYDSYEYGGTALHSQITLSEHTGTHIDAPKHFIPGGLSVDALPLNQIMGRGVKIDAMDLEKRSLLPLKIVKDFEAARGEIREGDIVMFRFGWDEKYALQPGSAGYLKDWPGLSGEAAEYLADKKVKAAGCDTLALDAFGSKENPAHHALLGRGIPIIENIDRLSEAPVFSFIIGLANKFRDGSGSPIRLIALVG